MPFDALTSIYVPIVGSHYHPPAVIVLKELEMGQELVLDPEPFNEWDPNAVKVVVRLSDFKMSDDLVHRIADCLIGYGSNWEEFVARGECLLGYVASTNGKFCKIDGQSCKGNLEVLEILSGTFDWHANLAFSPAGQPIVKLSY